MRQRVCVGHGPGWVLICQVDTCSAAAAVARPEWWPSMPTYYIS